jgi:hypothetical protein
VSVSPSSSEQTKVSNARSTASIDSRTTSAWRVTGEWMWWAFSHCIASDGWAIVGVAWLNSIGRGSTTSISAFASPTSIDGNSAMACGPAFIRTPSLVLPA